LTTKECTQTGKSSRFVTAVKQTHPSITPDLLGNEIKLQQELCEATQTLAERFVTHYLQSTKPGSAIDLNGREEVHDGDVLGTPYFIAEYTRRGALGTKALQ
jgi:hypothetical protein